MIGEECEVPELGKAVNMDQAVVTDAVFNRIRNWVKDCDKNHPKCPKKPQSSPRRLIDLGLPEPPHGNRHIRLVSDLPNPVKYIALSHCWGPSQTFTTTNATLEQRLSSIEWKELPRTYRDAVKVACKLHIRYIWIDSLCIIQDNP